MRKVYAGIDVGSAQVKVVIAGAPERPDVPMQILGTGTALSKGIRQGYVIDQGEAVRSIREALARAQASAKVAIKSARVALGGISLDEVRSLGDVSLAATGSVVGEASLARVKTEAEKRASGKLSNKTILHTIPLEYRVDGGKVLGNPEGLQGTKLSLDALLITIMTQHHDDLIDAIEKAGVEVEDVMAAPLAASLVTLTKAQKTAGALLANIGAETTSIIVFDNAIPVSLKTFPAGSADVTNALALQFQLPLPEAENLKRGSVVAGDISEKKVAAIVSGKLKELFTLINAHLKSIKRERLLPAGAVLTGGGANLSGTVEAARAVLKLPAQVGQVGFMTRSSTIDATWAVAYGLCRWAYAEDMSDTGHSLNEVAGNAWSSVKRMIRSLLP